VPLIIFLSSGVTFGKSRPLLVLIEGGLSSSSGVSMADLKKKIWTRYDSCGVDVYTPDNDDIWGREIGGIFDFAGMLGKLWMEEDFIEYEVDRITSAKYNPIVIVGHSVGGLAAFELGDALPGTSLVVTLDPVSYWESKDPFMEKPRHARQWIHVYLKNNYRWLPVPDWVSPRFNADKNLHIVDKRKHLEYSSYINKHDVNETYFPIVVDKITHFDVEIMYYYVRRDVERALRRRSCLRKFTYEFIGKNDNKRFSKSY